MSLGHALKIGQNWAIVRFLRIEWGMRFIRIVVGIAFVIASILLGLAAVSSIFSGGLTSNIGSIVFTGLLSWLLYFLGKRILKRKPTASKAKGAISHGGAHQFLSVSKDGVVSVSKVSTSKDCKAAVKELKLLRKSCSVQKRELNTEMKAIRARYTREVRHRGSKLRGGGKAGRVIRAVQSASRDSLRSQLADSLAPLENKVQYIDNQTLEIDKLITEVESHALRLL